MSQGDNKCRACGQWSGPGHRCPPPSGTAPSAGAVPTAPSGSTPQIEVKSRVAAAQAHLAAQAQHEADVEMQAEAENESRPLDAEELNTAHREDRMSVLVTGMPVRQRAAGNPVPDGVRETLRKRRGHAFYPPKSARLPKLYGTQDTNAPEKTIKAHYFSANSDFYLAEYDPHTGRAFGYSIVNGDRQNGEWGYIDLPTLEQYSSPGGMNIVERDVYWDPTKFKDIPEAQRY